MIPTFTLVALNHVSVWLWHLATTKYFYLAIGEVIVTSAAFSCGWKPHKFFFPETLQEVICQIRGPLHHRQVEMMRLGQPYTQKSCMQTNHDNLMKHLSFHVKWKSQAHVYLVEKVNNSYCLFWWQCCCLCPLGIVVGNRTNVLVTKRCLWQGTDQVDAYLMPCLLLLHRMYEFNIKFG